MIESSEIPEVLKVEIKPTTFSAPSKWNKGELLDWFNQLQAKDETFWTLWQRTRSIVRFAHVYATLGIDGSTPRPQALEAWRARPKSDQKVSKTLSGKFKM